MSNQTLSEGYLTTHFSLAELTHSNTAVRMNMSNKPSQVIVNNLTESAQKLWQPVRDLLGVPVLVNSGYRSVAVNQRVGGSATSAHCHGLAIDFIAPRYGNTRKIAKFLVEQLKAKGIKFDQLILEFPDSSGSWIHLGYKHPNGKQRGQVLTAIKRGGKTVYLSGLH